MPRDPRLYQIAVLSLLLLYGLSHLGFDVHPVNAAVIFATALGVQWVLGRRAGLTGFDARSPLISSLSLCLLLRTTNPAIAALAAAAAISSKFFLRVGGKHVFNPTNFGLGLVLLLFDDAWLSPGQWGHPTFFALLVAGLGGLVVYRSSRSDVTLAFLLSFATILAARALYLGQPLRIPAHQMQSGALLIFAFFMISDPKTTPDARPARILFAALVALGAAGIQFLLFRPNGPLWALLVLSPFVPLLDRCFRGPRYAWPGGDRSLSTSTKGTVMPPLFRPSPRAWRWIFGLLLLGATLGAAGPSQAFCGFFVGKADTKLFNDASQVVLARDGTRTVLTMVNDYRGDAREFALVVPIPTFLERDQIHVAEVALVDHLDAYTAPRLVEYHDPDPCWARREVCAEGMAPSASLKAGAAARDQSDALGVHVDARYTVGEYEIVILSAEQCDGLETWLVREGYRIPPGAARVFGSYLKQGMRFFVARVDLAAQAKLQSELLRPLQIAFDSPRFMLPIRLGMVNATGPQELFVYTLSRKGRVETTNYRTVRLPTDLEIPTFVRDEFEPFYRALFDSSVRREGMRTVFLEYAWDMGWCDPCAADPLSPEELRSLGAYWVDAASSDGGNARDVFVTRLHVRYDAAHFPEDLAFQETGDRTNFQGRYILRYPWTGRGDCDEVRTYRRDLRERQRREAIDLASWTGWDLSEIHRKMAFDPAAVPTDDGGTEWWRGLWPR